jgi:hypothetical protein
MTATFVNSSTAANATAATTGAVAAPASIAVGDVMILAVGYGAGATLTTLAGWTQTSTTGSTANIKEGVYWKVVVAGDIGATFTWTFTGTTTTSIFAICAYRGVTASPIDAASAVSASTGTTQTITTPAVTSVSSDNILVYIRGCKDDTGTATNAECTPTLNRRATNALTITTTVAHGMTMWDNGPVSVGSGSHAGLSTTSGTTTPVEGFMWQLSIANSAVAASAAPPIIVTRAAVKRASFY